MKKKKRFLTLSLAIIMFLGINTPILNAKEEKKENNTEFVEKKDFEIPKNELKSTGGPSIIGSGSYYKYFSNCSWVWRNNGWTLSITPTSHLIWSLSSSVAESAFLALYNVHKNDSQWKNTQSMKKQFKCHFWNAKPKSNWNIEPWRTYSDPWTCN